MENFKDLGQKIRRMRKLRQLTLINLSKKTHIDQATLSRIENGKMTGTLRSHKNICSALGCTLTELYSGIGERRTNTSNRALLKKIKATMKNLEGLIGQLGKD